MESCLFSTISQGSPLPLASLRLLVPPLQLLSASMWQNLKKQEVTSYWEIADFVSLAVEMVPELLLSKHRIQLNLGLRARYILELCRSEQPLECDVILSLLDKIKQKNSSAVDVNEEEEAIMHFLELIHILLKDPKERQHFFVEVFPSQYGPEYDQDLKSLFWEFLCRLAHLLPVPDLKQTVCWLGTSISDECVHSLTEVNDLKVLLQHHKHLRWLKQHVPATSMGDDILASLSAFHTCGMAKADEQLNQSGLDSHIHVPTVDEVTVEIIAVNFEENGGSEQAEETSADVDAGEEEEGRNEKSQNVLTMTQRKTHMGSARGVGDATPHAAEVAENVAVVSSHVNVRTSRRKRKPTMKVQVINLQKRIDGKNKQEVTRDGPPDSKCLPFTCSEHSYWSPSVSTKDADESERFVDKMAAAVHEGRFNCQDCDKTFKFLSLLKSHQRIHTGEQPFLCSQCGRRFSFKQSLERHKQTHKSGCRYECAICGEVSKSAAAQKSHTSAHTDNGRFVCSECGRKFAWKSALVRHLKTHADTPESPLLRKRLRSHRDEPPAHACSCGKSFAYRTALTAHRRIHQKERPHVCAQCGKGFLYKGGLVNHMKIHSEEMPFMCSFCGKCFKRERNMKKHERCHTGEGVYSCSQCDKSFVYKATLTRHELTHSGERPYLCSDCGKGFFSHGELLKHERFHTGHKPFQCPHCGKKFTQSCYLTIHLRYHTGVRPYSCGQCDKSFFSATRLKRHTQTHTGEKPFGCGDCGKAFKQSHHLKVHRRTHHIT